MSATEGKSERDLLDLAAKAAGHNFDYRGLYGVLPAVFSDDGEPTKWDPLTDDGDALRLSATLRISINQDEPIQVGFLEGIGGEYETGVEAWKVLGPEDVIEARVIYGSDPNAATRRAIVLAAAELGSRV